MSLLQPIINSIRRLSAQSGVVFGQFERVFLRSVTKLTSFRNILYAFITYMLASDFITSPELCLFIVFFIAVTCLNMILKYHKKFPTLQNVLKNIIKVCTLISFVLVLSCLFVSINLVFKNKSLLYNIITQTLSGETTTHGFLWKFFKLAFLPIYTIFSIYKKISNYCNMSDYKNKMEYNILTGNKLDESPLYDQKIPYFDILLIVLSYKFSLSPIIFLANLVDIILKMTDFVGHKRDNILLHTIMSCGVSLYMLTKGCLNLISTNNETINVNNID